MLDFRRVLASMAHSTVDNYIVPGLESYLIGGPGKGIVRLFQATRTQLQSIAPHSHRYAFEALVLSGSVQNTIWSRCRGATSGEEFGERTLTYNSMGQYDKSEEAPIQQYFPEVREYRRGDTYHMKANEIHSITFGKGAEVLMFCGPDTTDTSIALEPVTSAGLVDLAKTEPWMFMKGANMK